MSGNLVYAIKEGQIVHISAVEKGLACGAACPACGERLIARKGKKVSHHFAHHSVKECEYGYETLLHLAAKEIIARHKFMTIPPVYVGFMSSKKPVLISPARKIKIDRVELEKRQECLIPDIVIYSGDKKLFVEILVTHRVDKRKLYEITKAGISTIEIDLSDKPVLTEEELSDVVLNDVESKKWVYNSVAEHWREKFRSVSEVKKKVYHGMALHVDFCPIKIRTWHGKPYANVLDDCGGCEYFIEMNEDEILCSGKQGIASIEDFRVKEELRIKKDVEIEYMEKNKSILNGICPECKGVLGKRQGKYVEFWGCSNFPKCKFKAFIDWDTGEIFFD